MSPALDDAALAEYFKGFADEERRRSVLDLYRSGAVRRARALRAAPGRARRARARRSGARTTRSRRWPAPTGSWPSSPTPSSRCCRRPATSSSTTRPRPTPRPSRPSSAGSSASREVSRARIAAATQAAKTSWKGRRATQRPARDLRVAVVVDGHVDVGREDRGQRRQQPPAGRALRARHEQPAPPTASATPLAATSSWWAGR